MMRKAKGHTKGELKNFSGIAKKGIIVFEVTREDYDKGIILVYNMAAK